jgi:hypothetical protein
MLDYLTLFYWGEGEGGMAVFKGERVLISLNTTFKDLKGLEVHCALISSRWLRSHHSRLHFLVRSLKCPLTGLLRIC